jgi:hypothetical protein
VTGVSHVGSHLLVALAAVLGVFTVVLFVWLVRR